ncbi:MAG: hypothetical protein ABFS14_09810, partial [Gemmatimonadota bacterium]
MTSYTSRKRADWLLLSLLLWIPLEANAQELTYSGGIQYAGGDYIFEERTDSFYLTNGVRLRIGGFEAGVSLPVIIQNGGLVSNVAGGVPLPTGGTQSGTVATRNKGSTIGTRRGAAMSLTQSQLSSLVLFSHGDSAAVVFEDEFTTHVADPTFDLSGEVHSSLGVVRSVRINAFAKAPLTDLDSGVGSGEWDYGLGSSIALGAGRSLLFVDVSYWWFGDLSDLELTDGLSYAAGVSVPAFEGQG